MQNLQARAHTYLDLLGGIVPCVDSTLVQARVRVELSAVDSNWGEDERSVRQLLKAAVLPLQYPLGTARIRSCDDVLVCPMAGLIGYLPARTIRNGAVICFLKVPVHGERV